MKQDNLQALASCLTSADHWLTAEELAAFLHTTTRTVRNYVRELNKSNGREALVLSSEAGYRWNYITGNHDNQKSRRHLALPSTPNERVLYWIRKLLTTDGVDVFRESQELCISDSTCDVDLQRVKALARTFDVRVRRRNDMIAVLGKEFDKRRLAYYCIIKTSGIDPVTATFVREAFPDFDIMTIGSILKNAIIHNGLSINGFALNSIVLHIAVTLTRVRMNCYLASEDIHFEDIERYPEFNAALEIWSAIDDNFGFVHNEYEVSYMTVLLMGEAYVPDPEGSSYVSAEPPLKMLQACRKAINDVSLQYNLDLEDDNFVYRLARHFQRLLVRSQLHLSYSNPLATSIRNTYPYIYDVALSLADRIAKEFPLNLSDDEIAFLVFHIGSYLERKSSQDKKLKCTVVCPIYHDMHLVLLNKLIRHFGNELEIYHVVTTPDLDEIPEDSQIVITVLPVQSLNNAVLVAPFLQQRDFDLIRAKIDEIKMLIQREMLGQHLKKYLTPQLFETNHFFTDEFSAIHYICEQLKKYDYVDRSFERKVLEREKLSSTAFNNNIAVPHSIIMAAKKSAIYLIINKEPVLWGDQNVTVIALVAMSEYDRKEFHDIYDCFTGVFANQENLKALRNVANYDDFMRKFLTMF